MYRIGNNMSNIKMDSINSILIFLYKYNTRICMNVNTFK